MTKLQRFFFKAYLRLREQVEKKAPISDQERICYELVMKVLKLQNTVLSVSPLSNKRIISNEFKGLYIIINARDIHVLNNSHGYFIYMENDIYLEEILNTFNNMLEQRNLDKEKEIQKNIVFSLNTILSELNC